jgi:FdhD protein
MEQKEERQVITVVNGAAASKSDWLAREWPLTIAINGRQYITLLTTPANLDELAVGFALSEGLLDSRQDIQAVRLSPDGKQVELELEGNVDLAARLAATRVLTTGCGKGSQYFRAVDSLKMKPVSAQRLITSRQITELMQEFSNKSALFSETGAVHAAALAEDEIIVFREDVARHNAVDKLAGNLVLSGRDGEKMCLLTSGRISSELVLKSARIGLGLLLSRSAPTSLAVTLAEELGMTVIGFIRGQRFNLYCHSWRVQGL